MSKTKEKKVKTSPKQKRSIFTADKSLIIATLALIAIFFLPLLLSYTNFYPSVIPKSYIYFLDSVVADIPFLPKTPKQVVTKALLRNQSLKSYSLETSLQLFTTTAGKKTTEADIKVINSVADAASLSSKTKTQVFGNLGLFGIGLIDLATTKEANNFYINVKQFPPIPGFELGNIGAGWYKLDLEELQKGLSVSTRGDQQIVDDVRKQFGAIKEDLINKSLFSNVFKFNKVKQDGSEFYEVKFKLDENSFTNLPLISQDSKLTKPELTLWINTTSYFLTKLNLTGEISATQKSSSKDGNSLYLNVESRISKINQNQDIAVPESASEIKGAIDLALKLNKNTDAAALVDSTKNVKDLGENFLTIERLLTVLLLLPKAI